MTYMNNKEVMKNQKLDIRNHIKDHLLDITREELEELDQNYGCPIQGLHQRLFNEDYYIIGYYKAEQWLGDQTFTAINLIKEYEKSNFGKVTTDVSCSEKVVNMAAYILGEEILHTEFSDEIESRMKAS